VGAVGRPCGRVLGVTAVDLDRVAGDAAQMLVDVLGGRLRRWDLRAVVNGLALAVTDKPDLHRRARGRLRRAQRAAGRSTTTCGGRGRASGLARTSAGGHD